MDGGYHMVKMKTIESSIAFVLLIVVLVSSVYAFGVAGYADPVKVKPGESIDLAFRLQNMGAEGEDYSVEYNLVGDEGIQVVLLDNVSSYDLPAGTKARVNFRVIVPEDAKIGASYLVRVLFYANRKGSDKNEPLGIRTGMGDRVTILVSDETDDSSKITPRQEPQIEQPKGNNKLAVLVVLVLIAILIWAYVYYRNARKKMKK